jgi:hypothetical protein
VHVTRTLSSDSLKIDVYLANRWCDKPLTGAIGKSYVSSYTHSQSNKVGLPMKPTYAIPNQDRNTMQPVIHNSTQAKQGKACFECKSTEHLTLQLLILLSVGVL